jgi:uncharacterized membrane protein YfcA
MSYLLLVLTGVFAGLLGGLLGIGGSLIMLPAMVWILGARDSDGVEQIQQYMAAAMIVNFLLILPSVLAHLRNRAVWAGVWKYLAAAGIVGIVVGVQVSYLFKLGRVMYLRWGVGVFFLYVVAHNIYRMANSRRAEGLPRPQVEAMSAWRKLIVGFPMGVIAGLLGIGGGSLAVPGQQILLRMPLRNAIATSAATIATISWLGAILKNAQLHAPDGTPTRSLLLAACLAPTAMIGSYFGGRLTHRLPVKIVRIAFITIMPLAAYKMLQEPADAAVCWLLGLFAR